MYREQSGALRTCACGFPYGIIQARVSPLERAIVPPRLAPSGATGSWFFGRLFSAFRVVSPARGLGRSTDILCPTVADGIGWKQDCYDKGDTLGRLESYLPQSFVVARTKKGMTYGTESSTKCIRLAAFPRKRSIAASSSRRVGNVPCGWRRQSRRC